MNTNAGPSSMGPSGSGTLYAGTDSTAQLMQMLSTNGMIPVAFYQNVDKDHVDWGALAQQWIQMREQWSQPATDLIPSPPPPPSFSDSTEPYPPQNDPTALSEYEEQGEAPMEVEKEEENLAGSPLMLPPSVPGQTLVNPNATAAVASWQAKINQLYQIDHSSEPTQLRPQIASASVNQHGSARAGPPLDTESKPSRLLGLMDREIKLSEPCTPELVAPAPPSINGGKDSYSGGSVTMNEAKRKLLPAWIREGLEKMEREKQRQLEREQERKLWEEEQRRQRFVDDEPPENWSPAKSSKSPTRGSKLKPEDDTDEPTVSTAQVPVTNATGAGNDNREDYFELVSISVRRILTEILMDVTGEAISSIAKQTIAKVNKRKGKGKVVQATPVKTGLATIIGGLGLGMYGDSDEDDEEDEDEQQQDDASSHKKSLAKGAKSDAEEDCSTDDDLSDSAAERHLKEKIRRRQRDFEPAAREIEQWIASNLQYLKNKHGFEPYGSKPPLFRRPERDERAYDSNDEDREQDDEDEEGSALPDASLGAAGSAGSASANGYGDASAKNVARSGSTRDGETQPVNDKLYASQQFAGRKRRDKRVSRFSVLQEPRARVPSVPPATTYKLVPSAQPDPSAVGRIRLGDVSNPPASEVLLSKANQMLGQQLQLLGMMRPGGGAGFATTNQSIDGGSVGPTMFTATEQSLKRYLASMLEPVAKLPPGDEQKRPVEANDVRRHDHVAKEVHSVGDPGGSQGEPDEDRDASPAHKGAILHRKPSSERSSSDQRKSHHQRPYRSDRSDKGAGRTADYGHRHHRARHQHRDRSRSKSSRSRSRSSHSVSTRSRSSHSRSRSVQRDRASSKPHRAGESSSRHRHRSERGRQRSSRSRSRSRFRSRTRSRTRSRSRSRSSGRFRRSSSSKYSSRRRY